MSTLQNFFQTYALANHDYCVFGVATCFVRAEGEVQEISVLEPIPSAALEALLKGIPTSYRLAQALSLDEILTTQGIKIPSAFGENVQIPDDFPERTAAAARTYKRRPEAQTYISLGEIYQQFNHSTAKKRVLNQVNIVSAEDNVKQHAYTHTVL
ncbi:hypothetical protein [Picosynechococcus sp. NKBG15041c]|uniref:hypothetical protein n=1 Tax=Picosynechococcus sp. NKBG15041c TaxID=1407650 RepID=UPI0004297258|nr:hypothetical protein [Picosynechococcus sp. NKBG15041c]